MLAGAASLLATAALGASPADEAASVAQAAAEAPAIDNAQSVEEQMEVFVSRSGFGARQQKEGWAVVSATAQVQVSTSDANWVAERSLAYDEAILKATSDYVKSVGVKIDNKTTQDFYQAAGKDPPPYDKGQEPGQAAELMRKVLALGDARIDAELKKLGVDPKQYAEAQPPQQHVQLRNALLHKTVEEAFASVVGLTPVQTFEGTDGKGNEVIGVVAVNSPRMQEFAQSVSAMHGEFEPDPSRAEDLGKALGDGMSLLHQFGVRRMFDDNGLPVIVSFYQWQPQMSDADPSVNGLYLEAAFDQAEAAADRQIADFLNGSAEFDSESEIGHEMQKIAERLPDDYIRQDAPQRTVFNQLTKKMRLRSNIQVTGLRTFKKWSMKHPANGQVVVGVVRMWSAASEKTLRALRDGRPVTGASPAQVVRPNSPAGVIMGTELMKPGDF